MELPLIVNEFDRPTKAVRHITLALHMVKLNPCANGVFLFDLLHLIRL